MNKEWSELNKTIQLQLKKNDTFESGMATLFELRKELMNQIKEFRAQLDDSDFSADNAAMLPSSAGD